MFHTSAFNKNAVCPVIRMYSIIATALQRFNSAIQRMPRSTPEVVAAMVSATAPITNAICNERPCSRANISEKPTLSSTTPIPIDVATPNTVPTSAMILMPSPKGPRTRLPNRG
ncbi:hypothetical protein D3C79_876620 [compost metagenome]